MIGIQCPEIFWCGYCVDFNIKGTLTLGERVAIGEHSVLTVHGHVSIGDDFISAPGLVINDGRHDVQTLTPSVQPVIIHNRVWCGVRATILSGVEIGDDVVIGAGGVVCADIPSNCVAVGVPAKAIRQLERRTDEQLWTWVK